MDFGPKTIDSLSLWSCWSCMHSNICEVIFMGWMIWMMLNVHPQGPKPTWNLKITPLKRKIIFQTLIFGFHVGFWGCMFPSLKTFHDGGVRSGGWSKLKHLFRVSLPVPLVEDWDGSLPLQSLNLSSTSTNIYHTNNMYIYIMCVHTIIKFMFVHHYITACPSGYSTCVWHQKQS